MSIGVQINWFSTTIHLVNKRGLPIADLPSYSSLDNIFFSYPTNLIVFNFGEE